MEKRGLNNEKDKELPSVPTSYRILIKGTVPASDSKQIKVNVDDKRHIWRQCAFKNPSRSDGLVLRHWRHFEKGTEYLSTRRSQRKLVRNKIFNKIDDDTSSTLAKIEEEESILDSYLFARVNPSVKIYRYSDDFYLYHLSDLDNNWTKDETDLLFDLCEMFELRFIAIHDSFRWRKEVSLESIKKRYYSVTKRIVEFLFEEKIKNEIMKHGNPSHPAVLALKEESLRHPLVKFSYNFEADRERRQMLERSFRVSQKQLEKESGLLAEIKLAEQRVKNEEKKRSEFSRLKKKFNLDDPIPANSGFLESFKNKSVYLSSSCINFYKSQLTQHHNDTVDEMLNELNILPPIISSQLLNELYCIVRGDAAIMINIVNKIESLRKELEYWQKLTNQYDYDLNNKSKNQQQLLLLQNQQQQQQQQQQQLLLQQQQLNNYQYNKNLYNIKLSSSSLNNNNNNNQNLLLQQQQQQQQQFKLNQQQQQQQQLLLQQQQLNNNRLLTLQQQQQQQQQLLLLQQQQQLLSGQYIKGQLNNNDIYLSPNNKYNNNNNNNNNQNK